ncbi:MAG: ATP-binding cassette domain-containing protein [Halanaerobiales bacterium]|nr:ATP-binding cassette domain-containing protein [Halanaerobiales bacterium]
MSKTFKVAKRSAGLGQAIKALFHREYTIVDALTDVSFTIDSGEIVGYIGPNGAGKSTTIKVMSGILVPDKGKCSIMGHTPWKERVAHVKNIGVVFGQRSQLWWDVPVIDSFELLRDIYKVPQKEYKKNVEMLIETLDLHELVNTPVRQLSLGQRMRCEIAASLLHSPKILFLDEPTIGLDAVSKIAVRKFIKTINKEKDVTVILTTHDMSDIEALANRIILIGKGKILYDGNLNNLRNRFITHKTVTVDFRENNTPVNIPGTKLLSWSPERASISVDTQKIFVSEVISHLTKQLDIVDVTVNTQPIEEIIVQLYKEYAI